MIPEVVGTLLDNFEGLVERTLPLKFAATMLRGKPVGNLLPVFNPDFYRGDLHHLVYRPYHLHRAIDAVVRDTPDGRGMGAFAVGRSARQPEFSAAEQDTLNRLLPYLAHSMHRCDASEADESPTAATAMRRAAERHDDVDAARCWIESERHSQPTLFRLGQIFQTTPEPTVIATCDLDGWHRSER